MDITRDNFEEVYGKFTGLLGSCKYVAIDEEMTGIWAIGDANQQKRDDSPQVRYGKMIEVATKYSIIQFGLCLFHAAEDSNALVATPFNFYLFPNWGGDLVMSPSSIDFLRKNNMDFQKWIGKGITFVDEKGEENLRKRFFPTETEEPRQLIVLSRKSDIEFTESCMAKVAAMLSDQEATEQSAEVVLQPTNSYLRRVLYEQLDARFPDRVNTAKNEQGHIVVTKVDPATQEALLAAKRAEKERDFHAALGFRRVFTDLIAAHKPVVGHNCLFDWLFLARWLDAPLPESWEAFRTRLHGHFPEIYDTKYLATVAHDGTELSDTTLEACYQHYVKARSGVGIRINTAVVDGYDVNSPQYHNAGYDAYVTGCVFARQLEMLAQRQNAATGHSGGAEGWVGGAVQLYEPGANLLYMMRSCYHLQLSPTQPAGIVHLAGALLRVSGIDGAKVQNDTIVAMLTSAGLKASEFVVHWVDKETFLLQLPGHVAGEVGAAIADGAKEQRFVPCTTQQASADKGADCEGEGEGEVGAGEPAAPVEVTITWPAGWTVQPFAEFQEQRAAKAQEAQTDAASEEAPEPASKRART